MAGGRRAAPDGAVAAAGRARPALRARAPTPCWPGTAPRLGATAGSCRPWRGRWRTRPRARASSRPRCSAAKCCQRLRVGAQLGFRGKPGFMALCDPLPWDQTGMLEQGGAGILPDRRRRLQPLTAPHDLKPKKNITPKTCV